MPQAATGSARLQRISLAELQALALGQLPAPRLDAAAVAADDSEEAYPPAFVAQRAMALQQAPGASAWAGALFWVLAGDHIVGSCGFKDAALGGWVEIGYGIAPASRRRGLGTQAVRALCRLAFDSAGIQQVRACIAPGNLASAALARRLGFVQGPMVLEQDGSSVHIWALASVDLA